MNRSPPASATAAHLLDTAYDNAVQIAGENPNMLGFLRRVPFSKYFREPPRGHTADTPTDLALRNALALCLLAARTKRW